jgi:hypothetical protein
MLVCRLLRCTSANLGLNAVIMQFVWCFISLFSYCCRSIASVPVQFHAPHVPVGSRENFHGLFSIICCDIVIRAVQRSRSVPAILT